jgi:hypothetical protein
MRHEALFHAVARIVGGICVSAPASPNPSRAPAPASGSREWRASGGLVRGREDDGTRSRSSLRRVDDDEHGGSELDGSKPDEDRGPDCDQVRRDEQARFEPDAGGRAGCYQLSRAR